MMYIHQPSLAQLKQDLAAFIGSALPKAQSESHRTVRNIPAN